MATAVNWQIVGRDSEEIPRIDIDRDRRDAQKKIYTASRRTSLVLCGVLLFAATVSTPVTTDFFQQRRELSEVTHMRGAMDHRVKGLSSLSTSLDADQAAWRQHHSRDAQRHGWGDLLYSIAAAVPPTVYLDDLQIQGRVSGSPIVLQAETQNMSSIRPFVDTLSQSPQIMGPRLTETNGDPTDKQLPIRFRLDMAGQMPLSNESQ